MRGSRVNWVYLSDSEPLGKPWGDLGRHRASPESRNCQGLLGLARKLRAPPSSTRPRGRGPRFTTAPGMRPPAGRAAAARISGPRPPGSTPARGTSAVRRARRRRPPSEASSVRGGQFRLIVGGRPHCLALPSGRKSLWTGCPGHGARRRQHREPTRRHAHRSRAGSDQAPPRDTYKHTAVGRQRWDVVRAPSTRRRR